MPRPCATSRSRLEFELLGEPTTITTSHCGAKEFHGRPAVLRRVQHVRLLGPVIEGTAPEIPRAAMRCLIVVGSPNSSNSNRLRDGRTKAGGNRGLHGGQRRAAAEADVGCRKGTGAVGVDAGASAPEVAYVNELIARLKALGAGSVRQLEGVDESVCFTLPRRAGPSRGGAAAPR